MKIRMMIPKKVKWDIRRVYRFIFSMIGIKPKYIEINGMRMFLDWGDSVGYSTKKYEIHSIEKVKEMIRKGDNIIDVGASLGVFTLVFAKLTGAKGKVFAFEPDKDNFNLLKKTMKFNGFQNRVICENTAILNKKGIDKLYISADAGSHVLYDENCGKETREVNTISLDEYFKDFKGEINFIKVDADGSEGRILEGAKELISKNNNIKLLIEFAPTRLIPTFGNPKIFIKKIKAMGFKIRCINELTGNIENGDYEHLMEVVDIHTNMKDGLGVYVNLLCIKGD